MDAMEGLWLAWPEGEAGPGICVVAARDGKIVGSDLGYHFGGTYRFEGGRIIVTVRSEYFHGEGVSIWGRSAGEAVELSGYFDPKQMWLGGHFAGDNTAGETKVPMRKLRDWPA